MPFYLPGRGSKLPPFITNMGGYLLSLTVLLIVPPTDVYANMLLNDMIFSKNILLRLSFCETNNITEEEFLMEQELSILACNILKI
jgi:hypothetical protein